MPQLVVDAASATASITEDDATLEAMLAEAHIPALMAALVHITGDANIIRGEIRPSGALFGDQQAGISAEHQAEIRALALQKLAEFRDNGCKLPGGTPSPELIRELLAFMVGGEIAEGYVEFLMSELALEGADPYGSAPIDVPKEAKAEFHVVVIGAGMSGILAAIRLKEAGIAYTVIEKNDNVGGTWYQNQYPGCRVDSPNHTYSYSFEPQDWPQHFSPQQVLLDYFERVAAKHGLHDRIRLNTEVESATYDDRAGRWSVVVRSTDGSTETLDASAIISAVGQLNRPKWPDIPGQDSFEGVSFHSGEWEHQHNLSGKKIVVVGTGASAFQFVPEIAKQAGDVTIFQRTPPWIAPRPDYHADIPPGKHWLLNHVPFYAKWFRFFQFWITSEGLLAAVRADEAWNQTEVSVSQANDELRQLLTASIVAQVGDDPDLLAKAIPNYPPAGKRMLVDNGTWIRALKRDNVHVVTDPIAEVTANGVVTESGAIYEADIIVYATGFHASQFLFPMKVYGRGGVELHDHWDGDPRAYRGISIPGYPNLFCLYGPNTNIVVNGSIIFFSECEVRYIMGCLKLLLEGGHAAMDCNEDVHDTYNVRIDGENLTMAWGSPNVRSWYKNADGRVTQNWPGTLLEFWNQTRAPDPADYIFS